MYQNELKKLNIYAKDKVMLGHLCLLFLIYLRLHVITFGFGGPSEKNVSSPL